MHECISINGGNTLNGHVIVSGAKNSALPLLFATLLSSQECIIENTPDLKDIKVTLKLLESLGATTSFSDNTARIEVPTISRTETPYALVKSLRASFWALGPLLARTGTARVALPGGDAIGARPVDIHLEGLAKMGAEIELKHGVVNAKATSGLKPVKFNLKYPSVGATHNLLMAAALTPGETILKNAAQEPEVVEVAQFISSMGADIEGAGTSCIKINGRRELSAGHTVVIGDRIEAATYICAAAMTRGKIEISGIDSAFLQSTLNVLEEAGASVDINSDKIAVSAKTRLNRVSFQTQPFPGLATDVQPLLMAALTTASGISSIKETVFDNRFGHVAEYRRFGARIDIDGKVARITGVESLSGAPVQGLDIRAAAGMILLGLIAQGTTTIDEIYHLERGYDSLIEKFRSIGADISKQPYYESNELVFGC